MGNKIRGKPTLMKNKIWGKIKQGKTKIGKTKIWETKIGEPNKEKTK